MKKKKTNKMNSDKLVKVDNFKNTLRTMGTFDDKGGLDEEEIQR